LVASGLVDRRESSDDRRSVKIRLSRLGRREVKPLFKRARTLNDEIISSLGAEDSKNLKRILERIIENEKSAG
jgi:DNA-binding MarR family transcriptional regulator